MPKQSSAPDLFNDEPFYSRGLFGALGSLVSAHPSLAGGTVAFTVIFGFVAANALWQQPGEHPAPILKTRDAGGATAPAMSAAPRAPTPFVKDVPPRTVTTFRIERSDDTPTASIPVPNAEPVAVAQPAAAPAPARKVAKADPVLVEMQRILQQKGLYDGEIDGLMGPKSAAAIRAWEKANGYVETGEASAGLLAAMAPTVKAPVKPQKTVKVERILPPSTTPTPTPRPRPAPAVASDTRAGEPVTVPATAPVDRMAAPAANPVTDVIVSELVRQIQSGLSNIAYADIAVDGVAGSQTRTAIEAFEKHYRLPVTGEPNRTVLKKLIEIGAL